MFTYSAGWLIAAVRETLSGGQLLPFTSLFHAFHLLWTTPPLGLPFGRLAKELGVLIETTLAGWLRLFDN